MTVSRIARSFIVLMDFSSLFPPRIGAERRVPPAFSFEFDSSYEVTPGQDLNVTCVASGSPMPAVEWIQKGQSPTDDDFASSPIGRNILQLKNIQESANYTCVAVSKLGRIEKTMAVVVQALPLAPVNVSASEVTASSLRLDWAYPTGPVAAADDNDIKYYVIQYKPRGARQDLSEISGVVTRYYTVRQLSPYTEYEFYVLAVNHLGRGPVSQPAFATTGETGEFFSFFSAWLFPKCECE